MHSLFAVPSRTGFAALVAAAAILAACATEVPFSPDGSEGARASYEYCQQGGNACVLKPMALLVFSKRDRRLDFDFRSWILYDPRPVPGPRYIALMNETNDPVCEGYYMSYLLNSVAPLAMTCFPRRSQGRGMLHFYELQDQGTFAGKSAGTGRLETDQETLLLVHGATIEENRSDSFAALWDRYGGSGAQVLGERAANAKRIASLPRLEQAPASAGMGVAPGGASP